MNPFGYNLNSRCRNKTKLISNRPVSRNSDVFTYNERSEVVFSRGDAKIAEYLYDKIGDLLKYLSLAITYFYSANNHNKYATILRASATPREINPQCDLDGNLISKSGPLAYFFRHRFLTKYFDIESGLYYYGYRFYHPTLMRWLNKDPIEEDGGLNLYGFCGNRSCYTIDKLGLDCCPDEKRIIGFEYHLYNRFAKTKPNFKNARKLLKKMIGYIQLGTSGITSILDGLIAGAGKGISSILISGSDFIIDNARQPDTDIISKIEKNNTTLFFPAMDGVLHYQECEKYLFKFTKWVEKQIGPSKKVEIDLLNTDRVIPAKTFPEAIEAINKELLLKLKKECGSV